MDIVKVLSKGQIVIPNSLRESHHIQTGDRFIVTCVGNELRLKPAHVAEQSGLKAVAGKLQRPDAKKQSDKQINLRIAAQLRKEDKGSKS